MGSWVPAIDADMAGVSWEQRQSSGTWHLGGGALPRDSGQVWAWIRNLPAAPGSDAPKASVTQVFWSEAAEDQGCPWPVGKLRCRCRWQGQEARDTQPRLPNVGALPGANNFCL